jgi:hypothetical protein
MTTPMRALVASITAVNHLPSHTSGLLEFPHRRGHDLFPVRERPGERPTPRSI